MATSLFVQSCSPFGMNSFINIRSDLGLLNQPNNFDINSGGKALPTTPASGQSSDIHIITFKFGSPINQNFQKTADGHEVDIKKIGRE